jgi:hypothetical protein
MARMLLCYGTEVVDQQSSLCQAKMQHCISPPQRPLIGFRLMYYLHCYPTLLPHTATMEYPCIKRKARPSIATRQPRFQGSLRIGGGHEVIYSKCYLRAKSAELVGPDRRRESDIDNEKVLCYHLCWNENVLVICYRSWRPATPTAWRNAPAQSIETHCSYL